MARKRRTRRSSTMSGTGRRSTRKRTTKRRTTRLGSLPKGTCRKLSNGAFVCRYKNNRVKFTKASTARRMMGR